MCVSAAYQSLFASPQTLNLSSQRRTLTCTHMHSLSFTGTLDALFSSKHATFRMICFCAKFQQNNHEIKWNKHKTRQMPYHIWSIATCCVLKNEWLYLKHERWVCFSSLFILVDFPWGIVMLVSVDTLIEMCEVKTFVYINTRDLCSTIINLSPSSRDYTGFKWKNGFLQCNTEGF